MRKVLYFVAILILVTLPVAAQVSAIGSASSSTGGGSSLPVVDSTAVVKGSADATKLVLFSAANLTTGTSRTVFAADSNTYLPITSQFLTFTGPTAARTITLPDAAFTVARTDAAQTFTGAQTFSSPIVVPNGTGALPGVRFAANSSQGIYSLSAAELGFATSEGPISLMRSWGLMVNAGAVLVWSSTGSVSAWGGDTNLSRVAAGVVGVNSGASGGVGGTFRSTYVEQVVGGAVASATTITPTGGIFHVTGTTAIATINLPRTGFTGSITIIPDGIFTTTTAGNIYLASTAVVNKALIMTYDGTKWSPSY